MKFALPAATAALFLMPLVAQTNPPAAPAPVSETSAAAGMMAAPTEAANPSEHTTLTSDVMEALTSNPALGGVAITVNVTDNGVVSLNGVVPTQADADRAIATVKSVAGVKTVKSQILINQDPFAPAAAAVAPVPAATPNADAASNPQMLVAKALSANPALSRVAATIYGNSVILYGTVNSGKERNQAFQIVHQTLPKYQIRDIIYSSNRPAGPAPLMPPV